MARTTIRTDDINASAAIAQSKLATLVITDSEIADNAISGNKIDGGTISNFTSTGIDDNADATAITIDSSENVSIDTGNLVIGTAGKGIDFSAQTSTAATGAAATSEVLDHYEEGTWTPIPLGGSSITNATGTYVKIGNTVICRWYSGAFTGDGSSSRISGLPFTCGNVSNTHYGGCFSYHDTWSNGGQTGYVTNGNSYMDI